MNQKQQKPIITELVLIENPKSETKSEEIIEKEEAREVPFSLRQPWLMD